jgi:hypothetical protein
VTIVTPILSTLLCLIKGRNGKVERYLDEYQTELAGLPKKEMLQLKTLLANFDFAAAHEALLSLAAKNDIVLDTNNTRNFHS